MMPVEFFIDLFLGSVQPLTEISTIYLKAVGVQE